MKKIMIDLDDTIIIDAYLNVVNNYLNANYTYQDICNYWVDDIIPKEQMKNYLDYFYNKIDLYDYAKININAIDVIKDLTKNYEIFICSSYIDNRSLEDCANLIVCKHKWLLKNLPFIKPENFIFTSNKEIINTEIKIDDKIENLQGNAELKILITAYHNKNINDNELKGKNIIRADNWNEIAKMLLKY